MNNTSFFTQLEELLKKTQAFSITMTQQPDGTFSAQVRIVPLPFPTGKERIEALKDLPALTTATSIGFSGKSLHEIDATLPESILKALGASAEVIKTYHAKVAEINNETFARLMKEAEKKAQNAADKVAATPTTNKTKATAAEASAEKKGKNKSAEVEETQTLFDELI